MGEERRNKVEGIEKKTKKRRNIIIVWETCMGGGSGGWSKSNGRIQQRKKRIRRCELI